MAKSSGKKKTKSRNYYKSGKFKSVNWQAVVHNEEDKDKPTLIFTAGFYEAASDLKAAKKNVSKEFNNVTKQIKRIRNDKKTGDVLKDALTRQLNAYEETRKGFLGAINKLYNKTIDEYNDWMQSIYNELSKNKITDQGTTDTVQKENISADDEVGTEA